MKLCYRIKPPCSICPYYLGIVRSVFNPCPQCKMNHYRTFEQFQKQLLRSVGNIKVPKRDMAPHIPRE